MPVFDRAPAAEELRRLHEKANLRVSRYAFSNISKKADDVPMLEARDNYGRGFTGLRVSVTQRCNLNCPHCHREGQAISALEMTPGEIGDIIEAASSMGASKVKITGGEPLLRRDICNIISEMSPHVDEISLTSNGILVEEHASSLKEAGLDRINISMHSLSRDILKSISGRDCLEEIERGVAESVRVGLNPVKLNMVVLKGINDGEIPGMIAFAAEHDAILQLIELASDRSGCNTEYFLQHHFSLEEFEKQLAMNCVEVTHNALHRRARYEIRENGGTVRVEFVRSMHNTDFCSNCSRLRLTSDGKLKGCLYDDYTSRKDLLQALRGGAGMEEIRGLMRDCIDTRIPYWI